MDACSRAAVPGPVDDIAVMHQRGVFAEDQRRQGFVGQNDIQESAPPQTSRERPMP